MQEIGENSRILKLLWELDKHLTKYDADSKEEYDSNSNYYKKLEKQPSKTSTNAYHGRY